jgi:hypothetical protein
VDAIVGQYRVHLVGHCSDEPVQEVASGGGLGLLVQLDEGELAGPVDADEHVKLALLGPDLSNVDVKIADRISPKLAPPGLVALDIRQP